MAAQILDGKALAARLRAGVAEAVTQLGHLHGRQVCLATVLVGDDPASQIYVRSKVKACADVGMASRPVYLPATATFAEVVDTLEELNATASVNGILLQLPLPAGLETSACLDRIDPAKDVDGLHPVNQGLLAQGRTGGFVPCTPAGCLRLLHLARPDLTGLSALVIGRSVLVGRPVAALLVQAGCTVTIAHSKTRNTSALAREADILIAAAGVPELVRGDWIRPGAAVVDVGINRQPDGRLLGDVAYTEAADVAGALTPVPGGVGPMTIAGLLLNTTLAAYRQAGLEPPDILQNS